MNFTASELWMFDPSQGSVEAAVKNLERVVLHFRSWLFSIESCHQLNRQGSYVVKVRLFYDFSLLLHNTYAKEIL